MKAIIFCIATIVCSMPICSTSNAARSDSVAELGETVVKLVADDGQPFDNFGHVAIDGKRAVVGAYRSDPGGVSSRGAAYVFVQTGGVWKQEAKLIAEDGREGDQFGRAVALQGDMIVVGAPLASLGEGVTFEGAAYVFARVDGVWSQQQKIVAFDASPDDRFGESISIDGERMIVGSWRDDFGTRQDQGSAYIYSREGGSWGFSAKLVAPDGAAFDEFGQNVTIKGGLALVGAWMDDNAGNSNQGSVHVFSEAGADWFHVAKLIAADGASGDRFGFAVALGRDVALVGAPFNDVEGSADQGAVYAFRRSGAEWTQSQKIVASDGIADDRYGFSVAMERDSAVVGAFGADVTGLVNQGSAYVLSSTGGNWQETGVLLADDGDAGDQFGFKVALCEGIAVVGAINDDVAANVDQGSAYIFRADAGVFLSGFEPAGVACK